MKGANVGLLRFSRFQERLLLMRRLFFFALIVGKEQVYDRYSPL
jgi:hypothetical protein